jgi:VCBS repeat-containing protein
MKTIIVDAPVETTSYTVKAFVNPDKKIGLMVGPTAALDGTWSYDPSNNARILFTAQRGSSETYTVFIEWYDNHKATITISNWLKAMGTWSQ